MANMLAQKSAVDFAISILNGPDQGTQYKMVSSQITIGRTLENDIPLVYDSKCSRKHAIITLTPAGVELKNISERNEIFVNNAPTGLTILQPNDVIKIGKTKLQFKILGPGGEAQVPSLRVASGSPDMEPSPTRSKSRRSSQSEDSRLTLYIVGAVLIGGLLWLVNSDSNDKKKAVDFKTDTQVQNQIEQNRFLVEQIESERRQKGYNSRQYEQAQAKYIQGFRDYQKGQYDRARDHFQTCLSLFPGHALCQQYFQESQKKFRELIQYYLTLGKEYYDKGQYSACKAAYQNVKIMEVDRTSKVYQEADAGEKICQTKERGPN